ncbi:NmrA family NAD(P)-binding protein [Actinomadura sp. CNU-125]|uniref:NmrA family NAD(P)-binding protein n=1 Tax=Actinomadura sp. CNU-125 TaxID=1904961 RepID=UPI0021CCB6DA|nr:NmrA family NAD(P)-binding protein [Actinomadura sp. CNU-125]
MKGSVGRKPRCRARPSTAGPGPSGSDEEVAQGRLLADTAARLDVHLVYSSVKGTDRLADSKQLIEAYLREQPVRATVLGPVYFIENALNLGFSRLGDGVLACPLTPGKPLDQVSVLDIAGMAVHAVENPDALIGERIDIASDRVTGQEAARILSEVLGREIPYQQMPLDMVRQWAGEEVATMFENFENNTDFLDLEALHTRYPDVHWHGYADWAKTVDWDRVLAD